MKPCRECKHEISEQAVACPQCGAPYPAKEKWDGYGFECKSKATLFGLPWLHISFKYRPNRVPVPAKGIIAIGQFACGFFTLSQFGVGVVGVGQFVIGGYALAQFAFAYSLIAQLGLYIHEGHGQLVRSLADLIGKLWSRDDPHVGIWRASLRVRENRAFPTWHVSPSQGSTPIARSSQGYRPRLVCVAPDGAQCPVSHGSTRDRDREFQAPQARCGCPGREPWVQRCGGISKRRRRATGTQGGSPGFRHAQPMGSPAGATQAGFGGGVPTAYFSGNTSMRASAKRRCPRSSGWLMELPSRVM